MEVVDSFTVAGFTVVEVVVGNVTVVVVLLVVVIGYGSGIASIVFVKF